MNFELSDLLIDLPLNILNIVVLYIIVRCLVYKPVKKFMMQRSDKIVSAEQTAVEKAHRADEVKAEYEQMIVGSEENVRKVISDGRSQAQAEADRILEQARKTSESVIADARAKAESAKEEVLSEAEEYIAQLSISIAEKMIKREISDEDNKRIAREFFEREMKTRL